MAKTALMPTSKTLECITIEAQKEQKTEEIEVRTTVKLTHNNTKINYTKLYLTTKITKNLTQSFLYPAQLPPYLW